MGKMKLPIPRNLDPARNRCITLMIPDDIDWLSAFWGNLYNLTSATIFANDEAHSAKVVADVWWEIYQAARIAECCPDGPRIIDITESEYEMALCEQLRVHNGKIQALCCGEWTDIDGQEGISIGGPGQQGGGAPQPTPGGGCQTYHAIFAANSAYLVPTLVSAGDTLTFTNADGAGYDGSFLGSWNCPDGGTLFGDGCLPIYTTDGGDPNPAINHMALIAQINGVYYPAYSGMITVPGGVSNAQVTLLVNDAPITDNGGAYSVDVEVCNNATATWTHTFNFALSPDLFITPSNPSWTPGTWGTWSAGSGWAGTAATGGGGTHHHGITITYDFSHVTIYTAIMTYNLSKGTLLPGLTNGLYLQLSGANQASDTILAVSDTNGTGKTFSVPAGSYDTDHIEMVLHDAYWTAGSDGTSLIGQLVLTGPGIDPFL